MASPGPITQVRCLLNHTWCSGRDAPVSATWAA